MNIQSWIGKTALNKEDTELVISLYDIKQHSCFSLVFNIDDACQTITRIHHNTLHIR